MNVTELSRDEQLALVALTEVAVISDRNVTEAEVAQVDEIAGALGEEQFQTLAEEAEARFKDRSALKAFLQTITRPEARELILGTVLSETLANSVPHAQAEFLEWLSREWDIAINVEAPPAG